MPETILLEQLLQQSGNDSLLCIDENSQRLHLDNFQGLCISNRYDLYKHYQQTVSRCLYNDFDFTGIAEQSLQHAYFRIAKEKLLNQHIATALLSKLGQSGQLHLIGYREEGIESLYKFLTENCDAQIEKQKFKKQLQLITISKPTECRYQNPYPNTQQIQLDDLVFYSKPGVFGWQKIDRGSHLLIEQLAQLTFSLNSKILDLGCGYGYLSILAKQLGFDFIDATDNNAASIIAAQQNFQHYNMNGKVFADNCAAHADANSYDLILCNPPFHQGFEHSKQLIALFCQNAARALKTKGCALFVVNQFIGLEKVACAFFKQQQTLIQQDGFKVILLTK